MPKLCKPGHSGFLQRWWFLPRSIASQGKACPVLAQYQDWAEYWPSPGQGVALSTGPVLGRAEPSVLAQYWSSTGQGRAPVLAQPWAGWSPQYWPSTGQGIAFSTGPVLGRVEPSVLGQCWSSTGPVLDRAGCPVLAQPWAGQSPQYWPSTGQGRAINTVICIPQIPKACVEESVCTSVGKKEQK